MVVNSGVVLHIGGMTVTIVMADGKPLAKPLPGAGENNPSCAGMEGMANNGGEEKARSTSSLIRYGKEDGYLATHHSTALSGSPAAVNALAPIVAIAGNGSRKGGDPARMKTIESSPRIQGVWMLHTST